MFPQDAMMAGIATLLDAEMLLANHVTIYPHSVRWSQIEEEQGARGIDVSAQAAAVVCM